MGLVLVIQLDDRGDKHNAFVQVGIAAGVSEFVFRPTRTEAVASNGKSMR